MKKIFLTIILLFSTDSLAQSTVCFNMPNSQTIQDFVDYRGYKDEIEDAQGNFTPNPEPKGQYAKRMVIEWVRNGVRRQRAQTAAKAAAKPIMEQDFSGIN